MAHLHSPRRHRRTLGAAALSALTAFANGCSTSTEPSTPAAAAFVVEVSGETFTVRVSTGAQAERFRARLRSGARGVVMGDLAQGSGGFNAPWRWHLVPSSADVADVAIELCDGRPSLVEADLAYWIGSVKRFCPWGAKVLREQ